MSIIKNSSHQKLIRAGLSADALALIASELLLARCDDEDVNLEVRSYAEQLIGMLGGQNAWTRVCKGIGL